MFAGKRLVAVRKDGQFPCTFRGPFRGADAFDIFQQGSFRRVGDAESRIVVAHHDETRLLALLLQRRVRAEGEPGAHGETLGREFLRKQVRTVPEARVRPFLLHGIQPHAAVRQRRMPVRRRNRGILPLESDPVRPVRLFSRLRCARNAGRHHTRRHRLSYAVPVGVLPDERPAIGTPAHRLQMDDASIGALVLEMEEPVLPYRSIDPGTLMGTVYGSRSPGQDDPLLIGAEGGVGPEDRLPARGNPARRREDVILSPALVELGPFDSRLAQVSVVDDAGGAEQTGAVRSHRRNEQDALQSRPGTGATV